MPIRVLVADDHLAILDGLRVALRRQPHITWAGGVADGCELLLVSPERQPNIVIMDVKMPGMDGIAATRRLWQLLPQVRVIGLSMYDDEATVNEMLLAGAWGFLLKNDTKETVIEAIKTVQAGGYFLSPHLPRRAFEPTPCLISGREREVLWLLCRDYSTAQIAGMLGISPHTVNHHRAHLLQKSGAAGPAGLVGFALHYNLFPHWG